ncbi:hypothetical protein KKI23_01030 [Patescibacteria group bacterium]|nr:hypothetical protein [Patescibacteria group bacterium]
MKVKIEAVFDVGKREGGTGPKNQGCSRVSGETLRVDLSEFELPDLRSEDVYQEQDDVDLWFVKQGSPVQDDEFWRERLN